MGKLWEKGYTLNALVEQFTVGEDYLLDRELAPFDCLASIAHAEMLASIDILTKDELARLRTELTKILHECDKGVFTITPSDEDCHTAIENRLVDAVGETGKKIHTGRSRNDQVLAALRLYTRDTLLTIITETVHLAEALLTLGHENHNVLMPGRTHSHKAMPSSVGLWAGACGEELADITRLLRTAYDLNNRSPLGSAAGYGVPLPLDREMVAELLGFDGIQNNIMYVQNWRGKMEAVVMDALDICMLMLSRMASDLILYSLPEFGYFTLPEELCSGSSIMPQKRNPDFLELIRGKSAVVSGYSVQIKGVLRSMISGYSRDLQETKKPFMEGVAIAIQSLRVMTLVIGKIGVNPDAMAAGLTPEIYATDRVYALVREGKSFREAYREVAVSSDNDTLLTPEEVLANRTSSGTLGNLHLDRCSGQVAEIRQWTEERQAAAEQVRKNLTGQAG